MEVKLELTRDEEKNWKTILHGPSGSVSLYNGRNAGHAADMQCAVEDVLKIGKPIQGSYTRDKEGSWNTIIEVPGEVFAVVGKFGKTGSDKAFDLAADINKILAG